MRHTSKLSFWSVLAGALCALLLLVGLDLDHSPAPTARALDTVVAVTSMAADGEGPAAATMPARLDAVQTQLTAASGLSVIPSSGDFQSKYSSGGSSSRRSSSSSSGSRGYSSSSRSRSSSSGSRYRSSGYYDDDGGYYSSGGGCYGCGFAGGGFVGVIILIVVLVVISKVASGIFS